METLTINGTVVLVSTLSAELQNLAVLYDYTINKELEARKELAMLEAAKCDITHRLTSGYQESLSVPPID